VARTLTIALALAALLAPAANAHDLRSARPSLAALPVLPAATGAPDEPDLRIALPSVPYGGQVAPVYVDAYERPGRLLYRFDALIQNTGGTLDIFGGRTEVRQKIWAGGEPTTAPEPDVAPPGPSEDRTATGAHFDYVYEATHEHWHFFSAARYSLLVPGAAARVSDKVGFCLFDSFGIAGGATHWFEEDGTTGWCRPGQPASTFVRMGLSPGAADRYSAQREFQFVDVTGLAPGPYTLRAEANPEGQLLDADPTDDVHEEQRTIPGVLADDAALAVPAGAAGGSVAVSARAVAPEVPARRSAGCTPRATLEGCYLRITADMPLTYEVVGAPAHGTASFDGARLSYAPEAGYGGPDSLTYVATDGRGLRSAPATVSIDVAPRAAPPAAGSGTPSLDPLPAPRRLLRIGGARRTGARRLAVRLHCRPAARGACAGTLEARIAGRRAGRSRFSGLRAGRTRTVALRLTRPAGRRTVRLRATVRDAAGPGRTARRATRVR
jgi:hypothetical protein